MSHQVVVAAPACGASSRSNAREPRSVRGRIRAAIFRRPSLIGGLAATTMALGMAVAIPTSAASTVPAATTTAPSLISGGSAVLNATVNPNGTATT